MTCWKAEQGLVSPSPLSPQLVKLKVHPRTLWINTPPPAAGSCEKGAVGGQKAKGDITSVSAVAASKLSCPGVVNNCGVEEV